jgi:hypothetical protein
VQPARKVNSFGFNMEKKGRFFRQYGIALCPSFRRDVLSPDATIKSILPLLSESPK